MEKHSLRGAEIGRVRRRDRWNLPPEAVREAIVNAVVHADYSQRGGPIRVAIYDDRLEVENPGLLPFGLTLEDLPRGVSKVRNRVLGRVFRELGLVEQWGSGAQRMIAACREAGLPAPVVGGDRLSASGHTAERAGPPRAYRSQGPEDPRPSGGRRRPRHPGDRRGDRPLHPFHARAAGAPGRARTGARGGHGAARSPAQVHDRSGLKLTTRRTPPRPPHRESPHPAPASCAAGTR